jgi:hypothetical protein
MSSEEKQDCLDKSYPAILNSNKISLTFAVNL